MNPVDRPDRAAGRFARIQVLVCTVLASSALTWPGPWEPWSAVMQAIETVLAEGPRTPDMGGAATTADVGRAIAAAVSA